MVTDLPHQGRPLVLQQVPALGDEGGAPATLQLLASGGDKGVHHTSRVCPAATSDPRCELGRRTGRPSAKLPTCWLPTARNVDPVRPGPATVGGGEARPPPPVPSVPVAEMLLPWLSWSVGTRGRQLVVGPAEQLRPQHRRIQDEPVRWVDGIVGGQGPDSIQPVGDGPDGQVQSNGGRRGDTAGVEVRLQGVEKGPGATAPR